MYSSVRRYGLSAVVALVLLLVGKVAEAQNLRVVPVPWVATDPTVPHQAYNGHATTFKAIARGGNGNYLVEWDFQGDGTYDFSETRTNRYDLSARFTYPNQAATTTFQARVRVTSAGQTVTGTYPVRVFADVPTDPNAATERQLQVMRGVAVDDGLWFLHNQLARTGNEEDPLTGAQITGSIGGSPTAATSGLLWALSLNGHYAAFPSAYIGELPDPADNAARWSRDPYAEDAARCINYLLIQATIVGVSAADEANLVGFYPEVQQEPIYGTDDGFGIWMGYSPGDQTIYPMGHATSAFSVANLSGYVAQVGDVNRILGRRFEHILQQMVDALVWGQNDTGVVGSWYYTPNAAADDLSTSLWGMTGLWHADEFARDQGVIVPNLVKTRLIDYVRSNSNACPAGGTGGSYTNTGTLCDFTISAGHTLALGWVGSNTFDAADPRVAFPGYSATTRGQLRALYNTGLTFIGNTFTTTVNGQNGVWNSGFVEGGNFGRVDGLGNHYAMLHWQDAARAVEPEVTSFGANNWARAFSRYLINNQINTGSWNWAISGTLGQNSDSSGGPGLRAVWALLVLSPDAIPPLAIGTASVSTAPEGTTIDFNGSASDPGTGNPVYTWSFGNGATLSGQNVSYAFPDNGNFNVTLTATSIGGTSVDTIPVTITNVAPVTSAGPDRVADEGSAVALGMTFTDPGSGDTFTYAWNFGDATTANSQNVNHTWADNGVFNVSARVTDDDGGTTQDIAVVTINNVAPTITSTPGNTATEDVQYLYTATFIDPGTADTHSCSAPVRPAGMALVGCQLVWSPSFSQALGASAPVRLCVTDDDGGQTCQDFAITVTFTDADGDGLPDSWEVANFGNIAAQDQFGDPDEDGMNNLQEFNNVTDPNIYNGPGAPVPLSPVCGSEISSLQTNLVATNAVDQNGDALLYEFELFSDVGLTIEVASQDQIPQGGAGTTTWGVPVNLVENQTYHWRVRAEDAFTFGEYSDVCDFFVNTVNEAPGVPRINTPAFGAQVSSLTPALTVDNASDPDLDVLTYEFAVYADPALSNLVVDQAGVASGATTTTWTVGLDLAEDTTYYWRARATDPDGLSGDWSNISQFFVTTVNAAPESPVLIAPLDATVVGQLRPELILFNADDADFDALVYDWQLAADDTFATMLDGGDDVAPQGNVTTTFALAADLEENTRYCWRARSDDGAATSSYSTACFLVSALNDPPAVPTLMNPGDDSVARSVAPTFSWAPSTDPEGSAVTYDVEVMDVDGDVVTTAVSVSGTVTVMGDELVDGEDYTWHARAVDAEGEASQYSDPNGFAVVLPAGEGGGDPDIVVNGGGCSTGGGAGTGGLVLLGLGVMVGLRRRRI